MDEVVLVMHNGTCLGLTMMRKADRTMACVLVACTGMGF